MLGLRPRKRLSQSFLEDQRVAAAIVRAARVTSTTDVLEIGPGLGALTHRLARAARRVVAVEVDHSLAEELRASSDQRLTVVTGDVLGFNPQDYFDTRYTVVANLPYHITSPALRHLLAAGPPFAERLVVMVQAEVADRIAAKPGEMSALAVAVQVQARVKIVRRVAALSFYPRPKVDSAVMLLEPIPEDERALSRDELADFVALVQAGFKQPRKTLANSLADGLDTPKSIVTGRLEALGLEPSRRPQTLTVEEWTRIYRSR
jgi:16S rRNA (adenine1518-N6/adenine1519-N6)-dimethyltransferase